MLVDDDDVPSCAKESAAVPPLVEQAFFTSDETLFLHIKHKAQFNCLQLRVY